MDAHEPHRQPDNRIARREGAAPTGGHHAQLGLRLGPHSEPIPGEKTAGQDGVIRGPCSPAAARGRNEEHCRDGHARSARDKHGRKGKTQRQRDDGRQDPKPAGFVRLLPPPHCQQQDQRGDRQVDAVRLDLAGVANRRVGDGEDSHRQHPCRAAKEVSGQAMKKNDARDAAEHGKQPQRPFVKAQQLDGRKLGPKEQQRRHLMAIQRPHEVRIPAMQQVHGQERLIGPKRKPQQIANEPHRDAHGHEGDNRAGLPIDIAARRRGKRGMGCLHAAYEDGVFAGNSGHCGKISPRPGKTSSIGLGPPPQSRYTSPFARPSSRSTEPSAVDIIDSDSRAIGFSLRTGYYLCQCSLAAYECAGRLGPRAGAGRFDAAV